MAYVISAGWIGGGFGSVPAWLKCSVGIQGPPKRPYFSAWSTRATILLIMVGIIIFLFPRGRASNNVLQPERHSSNLGWLKLIIKPTNTAGARMLAVTVHARSRGAYSRVGYSLNEHGFSVESSLLSCISSKSFLWKRTNCSVVTAIHTWSWNGKPAASARLRAVCRNMRKHQALPFYFSVHF